MEAQRHRPAGVPDDLHVTADVLEERARDRRVDERVQDVHPQTNVNAGSLSYGIQVIYLHIANKQTIKQQQKKRKKRKEWKKERMKERMKNNLLMAYSVNVYV